MNHELSKLYPKILTIYITYSNKDDLDFLCHFWIILSLVKEKLSPFLPILNINFIKNSKC